MSAIPGPAMGQIATQGVPRVFGKTSKKMQQLRTPGWQMLIKVVVFMLLIIVFGGIYQGVIGGNPDDWAHPTTETNEYKLDSEDDKIPIFDDPVKNSNGTYTVNQKKDDAGQLVWKKSEKSIVNGFYASTVINSTVGYGDYYPLTQGGIILVCFNILITWGLFTAFF